MLFLLFPSYPYTSSHNSTSSVFSACSRSQPLAPALFHFHCLHHLHPHPGFQPQPDLLPPSKPTVSSPTTAQVILSEPKPVCSCGSHLTQKKTPHPCHNQHIRPDLSVHGSLYSITSYFFPRASQSMQNRRPMHGLPAVLHYSSFACTFPSTWKTSPHNRCAVSTPSSSHPWPFPCHPT